ncbi:ABC transporter ATP-binding protein [Mesorhizobium sp. M4A.F.Ca.ET.022.05.2.1]|uniref:dipeptide ABC transporter ATP-binding protein n=1 Tax=Mesorhizobium sp. M4A.F.Ca.ET.022.05.2.1 TaxID=2496653 RepID=UPI000FCAC7BF|nr:ABC transporter ATP-binding protein [Mesorhizobium sp. M4A.F.Ca.ET.022.05.2.1]RVC76850.1 ABC transporter ATP-binding protein [Mesorhizobium sp. M4A.F.Ca.ET.022.05.2.1]
MDNILVSVEDLSVTFDTVHGPVNAVKGVSFAIRRGEALGIVGESGSGKSVVCRALLQLFTPNAKVRQGRVLYDGNDVLKMSAADLKAYRGQKAAMIFQNPSTHLDPTMTVGDQVAEGLMIHRQLGRAEASAQAVRLLDDMKILEAPRRAQAYPHELSGGMRQRVMIAAALACSPRLLIADEPTTALDVTVQAQILALIRSIRKERDLTIVLVTHDLGVIGEVCDRIIVMKDGRIVEAGTREEILTRPKVDYTRQLIRSQPFLLPDRAHFSAPDQSEIMAVRDLSITFPAPRSLTDMLRGKPAYTVRAVDKVTISLRRGGCLGVVGESGSGKSTLARALVGLLKPSSGSIHIEGLERGKDRGRVVQMAFQDPYLSLNPAYTIKQTLLEPFIAHRLCAPSEAPERLKQLMSMVELPQELLHRKTNQLSGGQRQRVGIARALAMSPAILIADEVTSALDVSIQAQILELFKRLQKQLNLTLILISHDLAVVRHLCEEVAVMRHGKLVEYGRSADVLRNPQTDYTQALLNAVPKLMIANVE